jgi:hypothetical protein
VLVGVDRPARAAHAARQCDLAPVDRVQIGRRDPLGVRSLRANSRPRVAEHPPWVGTEQGPDSPRRGGTTGVRKPCRGSGDEPGADVLHCPLVVIDPLEHHDGCRAPLPAAGVPRLDDRARKARVRTRDQDADNLRTKTCAAGAKVLADVAVERLRLVRPRVLDGKHDSGSFARRRRPHSILLGLRRLPRPAASGYQQPDGYQTRTDESASHELEPVAAPPTG